MTFYGRIRIRNNILEGGTFLLMIHSQYRTGGLRYNGRISGHHMQSRVENRYRI